MSQSIQFMNINGNDNQYLFHLQFTSQPNNTFSLVGTCSYATKAFFGGGVVFNEPTKLSSVTLDGEKLEQVSTEKAKSAFSQIHSAVNNNPSNKTKFDFNSKTLNILTK